MNATAVLRYYPTCRDGDGKPSDAAARAYAERKARAHSIRAGIDYRVLAVRLRDVREKCKPNFKATHIIVIGTEADRAALRAASAPARPTRAPAPAPPAPPSIDEDATESETESEDDEATRAPEAPARRRSAGRRHRGGDD